MSTAKSQWPEREHEAESYPELLLQRHKVRSLDDSPIGRDSLRRVIVRDEESTFEGVTEIPHAGLRISQRLGDKVDWLVLGYGIFLRGRFARIPNTTAPRNARSAGMACRYGAQPMRTHTGTLTNPETCQNRQQAELASKQTENTRAKQRYPSLECERSTEIALPRARRRRTATRHRTPAASQSRRRGTSQTRR